jgi:Sugar (and other) transporter
VPRYVAETAPPAIRGALGSLSQLFICSGILLAYLAGIPYIDSPHPEWAGTAWWRFMLLLPVAPALLQARGLDCHPCAARMASTCRDCCDVVCIMPSTDTAPPCLQSALLVWCPESPVWLRWHGRHAEARGVERRLSMPESSGNSDRQSSGETLLPGNSEAQQHSVSIDQQAAVRQDCGEVDRIQRATTAKLAVQQAAVDTSWSVLLSPSSRYANMMLLAIGVPLTQQVHAALQELHLAGILCQ